LSITAATSTAAADATGRSDWTVGRPCDAAVWGIGGWLEAGDAAAEPVPKIDDMMLAKMVTLGTPHGKDGTR
jgi:hypothetical protein